jgi:hypothetical protein
LYLLKFIKEVRMNRVKIIYPNGQNKDLVIFCREVVRPLFTYHCSICQRNFFTQHTEWHIFCKVLIPEIILRACRECESELSQGMLKFTNNLPEQLEVFEAQEFTYNLLYKYVPIENVNA